MVQNKGLYYVKHPEGPVIEGEHIEVQSHDFDLDQEPPAGGAIIKINYASFDPYLRPRMAKPDPSHYAKMFTIGQPIDNFAVATILKSSNPDYKPNDLIVLPDAPITEYAVSSRQQLEQRAKKLDNPYNLDPRLFLGALGMPGLTAYSSFYAIGQPKKGETIYISAASGAVGQLVGQLAKHEGLKVIGSVGDEEKLNFILKDLGFDGGFNYKKEKPLEALQRLAPDGIDIYYDNVGGDQLEAAISAMNQRGRIVACGAISQYNTPNEQKYGIRNTDNFFAKRLKMQGFIVTDADMGPKYTEEHQKNVQKWIEDGSFKTQQTITKGMDNAAKSLLSLFEGKNFGKVILEVSPVT